MNASRKFPKYFSTLMRYFIGKFVMVDCHNRLMPYVGVMTEANKEAISISNEKNSIISTYDIPFSNIHCVCEVSKLEQASCFEEPSEKSEFFRKYSHLIGREIEVVKNFGQSWQYQGKLMYIGEDYFIIFNSDKKQELCLHMSGEFKVTVDIQDN